MVIYRHPFHCLHIHRVWKSNSSSNLGPVLTFHPSSIWESLVEGLMVIWSMLLNELTQPLTDVPSEASVVSSDPWICIEYE